MEDETDLIVAKSNKRLRSFAWNFIAARNSLTWAIDNEIMILSRLRADYIRIETVEGAD